MAAFEIPCPQCGRKLKLADRALLGRKARCAACGHRFVLKEPDEARSIAAQGAPRVRVEFAALEEPESSDESTPAENGAAAAPAEPRFGRPAPASASAAVAPVASQPAPELTPAPFALADDFDEDMTARIRKRQLAARRRRRNMIATGLALALVAGGIVGYLGLTGGLTANRARHDAARAKPPKRPVVQDVEEEPAETVADAESSRKPEPITLQFVPEGARVIVHLRPAELWQPAAEEFRACLGPLGVWLEKVIKERCLLEPAQIDEALFALIPASRDDFDLAVVVRSKQDLKKSELIEKFEGELVDLPRPHYVGKERAWFVRDPRTFATAPKAMAAAMIEAESSSVSSDGVQALLAHTDRRKQFTLVCELEDVRLGAKNLAPQNTQDLLEGVLDFFGEDVETIAWSVTLGESENMGKLVSELLVRNRLSRAVPKLEVDLKKKLAQLPKEMLELVYKTHEKTIGETKIVGRFPAMTKVVERSTKFETGRRLVTMHVELPERAGPNLAVGALLTWDQTNRPGYGKTSNAPAATVASKPRLPDKIADRLQTKITVDFRNDFLYAALDYIGGEIGVKFVLDGPGMKEVAATQNEKQEFAMENVPVTAVLAKIFGNRMVLVVDEEKKIATVTSQAGADRMKRKPFPLTSK